MWNLEFKVGTIMVVLWCQIFEGGRYLGYDSVNIIVHMLRRSLFCSITGTLHNIKN
jgi:hypothetical protein